MASTTKNLSPNQRQFLENPYYATVTTLREDGSPQTTVVWVDVDEEGVFFNTASGRAKPRHLESNPALSLNVIDPGDGYRWISVSGRAEITADGADASIDKLAKKYLDQEEYPWRKPGEQRLIVRIRPEHIEAHGLD